MSKILTTAAAILVLGLTATGAADARGGGHIGGFGGGLGGMGGAHIGGMGGAHIGGLGRAHLGGIGAAHMDGLSTGHVGAMGGTQVGGRARVAHDFGRHDRRFDPVWGGGYAASCVIYEPYYRPWCAGDVDSGILSPDAVY
jgi:hypothetical protein